MSLASTLMDWITQLEGWLPAPLLGFVQGTVKVLLIYAGFLVLERIRPVERRQPLHHLLFNVQWWIVYSAMTALLMGIAFGQLSSLARATVGGPLLRLARADTPLAELGHGLVFLLVFDFFYYWFHRLQHRSSILWQQHMLHHTETSLNVTTTQRHHWLEAPLRVFFITIPMALLIDAGRSTAGLVGFTLGLWGFFIHMNVRLDLGPLSWLIAGPQVHRIHHSIESKHLNRNFAAYFPVWDVLFGSFWRPARGEYPDPGLAGVPNTSRLRDAWVMPFRAWMGRGRDPVR